MAAAQQHRNLAKTGDPQQRLGEGDAWDSWTRTSFDEPAARSDAPGINAKSLEKLVACAMNHECALLQVQERGA
jgi:hypothetical protein